MRYKPNEIDNPVVVDISGKTFAAKRCRITDTVIKFMLITNVTKLQAILDQSDIITLVVWDNRVKTFEGKAQYCFQKENEFTFKPI